jgi:hypothetical protein
MFFVLKFELILIIGSNNVLTEGAKKYIAGAALDRAAIGLHAVTGIALLFTSLRGYAVTLEEV